MMAFDPTTTAVPVGVVALLLERTIFLLRSRNGSAPVSSDKVRLIIQEELEPVKNDIAGLKTDVAVLKNTKAKGASA